MRIAARAVDAGRGIVRYFDPDDCEIDAHPFESEYVEEDGSAFFIEDYKHWFNAPVRVARMELDTGAGVLSWRLDDCGINHEWHPEHVHEVKPCELLKLSLRYAYDPQVTTPPLER